MDYDSNKTILEQLKYEDKEFLTYDYHYDYEYEGEELIYEDKEVRIVYLVALPILLCFGIIGN